MKRHEDNLPWYVNDTLDERERREVEAALEADPALKREARFLQALRGTLQAGSESTPGEFGLARLKRDIVRERQAEVPEKPARSGWKLTAVAASLLVVLQAGVMFSMVSAPPERDVYVPFSGPAAEGPVIQLTFRPETTEAQIRAAVNAVDGILVGGPGALGVYYLALPGNASVEPALETLRGYAYVEQAVED